MMNERREKIIKRMYGAGIKKSKKIEDKGQKYNLLNDDLINMINNINSNFDFKTFNKDTLNDVEIVRTYTYLYKIIQFFEDLKELITNKDDILIESIEKGLNSDCVEKLLSFWNDKVIVNLKQFFINKKIFEAIDEIDKRVQQIDEKYQKKNEKEKKQQKMISMHNEGKTKTTYKKPSGNVSKSQFLFNTPNVTETFQNVIKEAKGEEGDSDDFKSLDNASFIYKKEELDKNIISITRYKKAIIGYMDLDVLLQRIAMEQPIFYEDDMNDYLLEGLCLQHSNFILTDVFIKKINSCYHFNFKRYEEQNENENEENEQSVRTRTENFLVQYGDIKNKKNKRIFIGSKDEIDDINGEIEIFKDTEKRLPYGLIQLIISYINLYKKYSLSNIELDIASIIIELFKHALNVYEIKNIYENGIKKAKEFLQTMIEISKHRSKAIQKVPFDKIYNITDKNESFFDIFCYSSKVIATELTRVSYLIFSKITPKEFFKGLFTKKDKEKTSPNICKAVQRFNNISFWVIEEVLSYDYSSDRAKVIEKFIHIAHELSLLNNFNDCMSIVSALGQMILTKLNKTWKKVASKNMTLYRKIKKLLNFQNNYKNIRDEITKCINEDKPFLPFLGYYTKRICFLEESGPYVNKSGLINVDKISQVEQILSEFYEKNRTQYTFDIPDEIRHKLIILQCLDPNTEEELEKEGNLLEPNFLNGKKTKNKRITYTEKKFEENYNKTIIL